MFFADTDFLCDDLTALTTPFADAEAAWFWYLETSEALHSAIAFIILEEPEKAGTIIHAMGELDTIWTVGLSVLGIYIYKRSKEKTAR